MGSSPFFPFFLFLFATLNTAVVQSRQPLLFPSAIYHSSLKKEEASKSPSKPKAALPYKTRYFPQQLDHFTFLPQSYKIFYQKYLINDSHWHRGAPIFVYTGNEGNIEWFAENTGFLLDIAPKFKALLLFIEHRFYGESLPFGKDTSKSANTLGYLNSQQALADYAVLIRSLKQNLSSDSSPVVVFGGSYGGMLASWFRLKYPHIAIGALASSAPILQFEDITPWSSFFDAITEDFKEASLNCYEVIKGTWQELDILTSQKQGLAEVSRIFRTCKNLKYKYSAADWLSQAFIYTAMVNYPTKANFMKPLPAYPVEEMCKIIDKFPPGTSKINRAFAAASLYYNYSNTHKCFDLEHASDDDHGVSGWDWQACTEMVMPMTSSSQSMFPLSTFSYDEFSDGCEKEFGVKPRPHWITTEFGGNKIEQVLKRFGSNIIFSNGLQDPWSRGSVLTNISDTIVAILTKKGAHHADFRGATKDDPKWLIDQRRQEEDIIQKWLDEYYRDHA